jgi:hypothetical protein
LDHLLLLKNLGPAYSEKLKRSGLSTIGDLKWLTMEAFLKIVQTDDRNLRVPHKKLSDFVVQAKSALPGAVPGNWHPFEQASKSKLLTHPFHLSQIK